MRKGLIGLLLCTLLLPVLLWLTLPWTAQYLLQQWLQQQGFEQPRLVIRHPSWQRLQIDRLSVSQRNDGHRLQLQADNIDIRFTPLALLQGKIQELRIERARLEIEADASIRGRLNQLEQQPAPLSLALLHPAQLFRYAPSKRLVIAQIELQYNAPEQPEWRARGNLDLEPEQLQSRLQLLRDTRPLGYLDLSLDQHFNLALSLSRDNLYLLRSAHKLTFPDRDWLLRSDLLLDAARLPAWLAQLQPNLELPVQTPSGQVHLSSHVRLPGLLPTRLPDLLNRIDVRLNSRISLTTGTGPGFDSSHTDLTTSARLRDGLLSLSAETGSELGANTIQQPGLSLETLTASLTQPLQLNGHWQHPEGWTHSTLSLELTPGGIQLPQPVGLDLQPVRITLPSGKVLRSQYPLSLNLPDIRLKPADLPALNLSSQTELQLDPARLSLQAHTRISGRQLPVQVEFNTRLDSAMNGSVDFQLPATEVAKLHSALRPWLPPTLSPLTIQQGTLSAKGNARFTADHWSLDATPVVRKVDLTWDEHTRVSELNLTQQLRLTSGGQLSSSGQLDINHTDSGIRIFGPRVDFDLNLPARGSPRLRLSSFSLSALDGIIAVPALSFDPSHPVIDTRIAVSALELERLLALYPQEGLYGSGVLGGALPLRIDGNQVSINQGQLVSQGDGGVIRYQPPPEVVLMGQQNPGIQFALDALTDFRFDLLDLTLNYAPDGEAIMRARLKGHNPDWQQGRAVDLNLNIEENLLDLLRTLRLTDRVTDAIDRRFRR